MSINKEQALLQQKFIDLVAQLNSEAKSLNFINAKDWAQSAVENKIITTKEADIINAMIDIRNICCHNGSEWITIEESHIDQVKNFLAIILGDINNDTLTYAWVVSYLYYKYINSTQSNWKNAINYKYLIDKYNLLQMTDIKILNEVLKIDDNSLTDNITNLNGQTIKNMARIILEELNKPENVDTNILNKFKVDDPVIDLKTNKKGIVIFTYPKSIEVEFENNIIKPYNYINVKNLKLLIQLPGETSKTKTSRLRLNISSINSNFKEFGNWLYSKNYKMNTINSYIYSCSKVQLLESESYEDFVKRITEIRIDYDTGGIKEDDGHYGHNTVICALKQFEIFIKYYAH